MAAPPPKPEDAQKQKGAIQPKDEVGTRKGFRRYKWEFRDSNTEFWTMGHAEVKLVSLICMMAGLHLFETMATHPILILLLTMEVSIFTFFIFLYSFAINRYMPFIFWPITDLFNDLFSGVFLIGGIVFAVKARRVMPKPYIIAMVLMGVAAIFVFIDLCLQRQHLKGTKIRNDALADTGLQMLLETEKK